ncbi:senescence associated gene 20-like [Rhodamnia argentea]|uniref:Senescence associated gene 20-like n=1 Tax=Rhodamnia argentea TaxID=178133 RepID=A0A8B8Q3Z8_9MYRT|nr:senescence associated gene 20-like [Rhodamnia argentea]
MAADDFESTVPESNKNKVTVEALYAALALGDSNKVAKLLASDLEWWFHGPPGCQHMMRVLTGKSYYSEFTFHPRSLTGIGGDYVIVEGWEGAQAYWVHVWTWKNGQITQFREYFNTSLTVREVPAPRWTTARASQTLWQSQTRELFDQSLPGLLLAI